MAGNLFVIADLHLSFASGKPMDIFGSAWANHVVRLEENWRRTVDEDDIVIVPGDLSWALKTYEAVPDLAYIDSLPGKKILMKGNHELWWSSAGKLRRMKEENNFSTLFFLYNNAFYIGGADIIICGTRGWKCPGCESGFNTSDMKVYKREQLRLGLSLDYGKKLRSLYLEAIAGRGEIPSEDIGVFVLPDASEYNEPLQEGCTVRPRILSFFHYPPFNNRRESSAFTSLLEKEGIKECFFGHLHGIGSAQRCDDGTVLPVYRNGGIKYYLTAADFLELLPARIGL